ILVAAKLRRADATRLSVKPEEAADRADAHFALLRGFRNGGATLDRHDHSSTQILRKRLRHPCWPLPAGSLNHIRHPMGIPRFSLLGKRSKGSGCVEMSVSPS